MSFSLFEDAFGDIRNAHALAWASEFAYLPEPEGQAKFRSEFGMESRLISVDNTQAYVCGNDDHLLVAFRGTEGPTTLDGLKDWLLTDAMNLLIVPEGRLGTDLAAAGVGARFHQGFVNAIAEIWDPVYQAVETALNERDRPLWLTGHSLGGALALLAGWLFHRKMISVHQIYTFGGPMIGNQTAVDAINREFENRICRFVNGPDPVPRLPMMSLVANEYSHCDREVAQGDDAAAFLRSLAGRVLDLSVIDEVWDWVHGSIAAHNMANYRSMIERMNS